VMKLSDIKRVGVIDDYDPGRDSLAYKVEDADREPIIQKESVSDLNNFLSSMKDNFDAIVTDHHLRKAASYFPIDGAELVAHCYDQNLPSLLVTRFENSEVLEIRRFRKKIPVLLTPDEFNAETLISGLEKCINEFKGNFTADRKVWRTLVRVEDIRDKNIFLFIPGWNSQQAVALNTNNLPEELQKTIKPDMRLFAGVNIGCENFNDLFITNWEY
jgi:hypothetical protein